MNSVNPASAFSVSSHDVVNFSISLECPVTTELMVDAEMLIPCGHTISEVAAKAIYTGMEADAVIKPGICPICRVPVRAYYPNLVVQSLAQLLLVHKPGSLLEQVSASVQGIDVPVDLDAIQFPGIRAKFVHTNGDWSSFNCGGGNLNRNLIFKSSVKGSLFNQIQVLGYNDGDVSISVDFNPFNKLGAEYFRSCGILMDFVAEDIGSCFSNKSDTKLLFNIIAKNNEIPEPHFSFIRNLINGVKYDRMPQQEICASSSASAISSP